MEQLEHRVIKLEIRVEDHAEELKELRGLSKKQAESLSNIERSLAQIKWISIGIIAAYTWQTLGLEKMIKVFL